MSRFVTVELDDEGFGSVSFDKHDEYEVDRVLASLRLDASKVRPHPKYLDLKVFSVTPYAGSERMARSEIRETFAAKGYEVRDSSTL